MISGISHDMLKSFYEKCDEYDIRVTPQRVIIYTELINSHDHPSVTALYKRVKKKLPNISFDTVYRTALSFVHMGMLHIVEGHGEEKRFDPNVHNHHHIRCIKCRTIIDFKNSTYDALIIPQELQKQFKIITKRVVLEGICKKCSTTM
ncbi:MAG: transcriptional repressor [Elusimicrobia bacterium]|nr:transcriptional repressor [Elusimicrobiota bacterium]